MHQTTTFYCCELSGSLVAEQKVTWVFAQPTELYACVPNGFHWDPLGAFRDRSLITGRGWGYIAGGELQSGRGASEVLPLGKKGGEGAKGLAMLKGGGEGGTKNFEVVSTWELEVLVILKGGAKVSTL